MRVFVAFFKAIIQNAAAYRLESLVWMLIESLPILIMASLWTALRTSGQITHDQSVDMVFYYILVLFISRVSNVHFEEWLIEEIKDGMISSKLTKPFPFITWLVAHTLVHRLLGITYTLPVFIFMSPFYLDSLSDHYSLPASLLFLLLLIITFLHKFFTSWLISLSAFWIDQSSFLSQLKWMLEGVVGGAMIPLTFLPLWWQTLSRFTPFYYWYFFPIHVFLGKIPEQEIIIGTIISIIWLMLFYLFSVYFWKKSLIKYSATGG